MKTKPPLPQCPRCQTDQTSYQAMETAQPSFCLQCRFPLTCIAGKYYPSQVLAKSNQSTLYLAHHHQLKRKAERVIKVLSTESLHSPDEIKRFYREVQITAELSQMNEHIVRIYDDFGEIPYFGYFYVMEYIEGSSLHDYMANLEQPLPPAWGLDIALQLCEALQTAHENGVIHRDLNPQNVMILQHGQHPLFVKLLDWGIAKTTGEGHLTAPLTQYSLGTPLYMSPEQVFNQKIDARTDIYAMGIILFELLAGINPFSAKNDVIEDNRDTENTAQTIHAQIYQQPPPLKQYAPKGQSTEALEQIVKKAMAKDPEDRYQDISALKNALEQAVNLLQFELPSDGTADLSLSSTLTPHSLEPRFDTPKKGVTKRTAQATIIDPKVPDFSSLSNDERNPDDKNPQERPEGPNQEIIAFLEEDHLPLDFVSSHRLAKFLGLGVILLLLWWLLSLPETPTPQTSLASQTKTLTEPPNHIGKTTIRSVSPDKKPSVPEPSVPKVQVPEKKQPPKRPTNKPSNFRTQAKMTKKTQKKSKRKRKKSSVQKRPIKKQKGCGHPAVWVQIEPYLSRKSEVIAEGGKTLKRNRKGACISHKTHRLSIMQRGYALCIFRVRHGSKRTLRVKLKLESGLQAPDYCIH